MKKKIMQFLEIDGLDKEDIFPLFCVFGFACALFVFGMFYQICKG